MPFSFMAVLVRTTPGYMNDVGPRLRPSDPLTSHVSHLFWTRFHGEITNLDGVA